MPIQPINFPKLSFDEANPFLVGAGKGQQLAQNFLMFPEMLKKQMIENALQNYKAQQESDRSQYYPRLNQSEALKAEAEPREMNARAGLYGAEANKYNTLTPLEAEADKLKNKFYPDLIRSQIESQKSASNLRNMGGSNAGAGQKEIGGLIRQILIDRPDLTPQQANQAASASLSGSKTLPDGTPTPTLSGLSQSIVAQIQKRNSTAAVQNQAANFDILANDLNSIDITPLKTFASIPGRLNVAKYTADMAAGKDVPQEFRDYLAFKDVTANFAMDALRKGFGTSVVPEYVYSTLGKASNPGSTWWNDPKQVETNWKTTTDWINKNARSYKEKATKGVGYNLNQNDNNEKKATLRYNQKTGDFEEIK